MTRLLAACIVCALGLLLARRSADLSAHGECRCGHRPEDHRRALPGGPYPAPCHHGWADGGPGCRCGGWEDRDWLEERPWRDPYPDRLEVVRDALGRLR